MKVEAERPKRISVARCPVDRISFEEVVCELCQRIEQRQPTHVVFVNAAKVVRYRQNPELRAAIDRSDMLLADGVPIVWASKLRGTPLPGRVNGTAYAHQGRATLVRAAEAICQGRYPLLSYENLTLGFPPPWHLDFVAGKTWEVAPGNKVSIVRHDGSDVKTVWEPSRLQFLPVLGKAYCLTSDERFREAAKRLTTDWLECNPVGQGVNWTCAMEAALRAMSILFLLNLLWPLRAEERGWLERVTLALWQHLLYIEGYLEFSHISRSNHYVSDIVGLYCLSAFLDGKEAETRRNLYRIRVEQEILHQVYEDGGDYEASLG